MGEKLLYIVFCVAYISLCSCKQKGKVESDVTKPCRLLELDTKQDLIKKVLQDSTIIVKSSLCDEVFLCDINCNLFLYISDKHCLTCMESVLEEVLSAIQINNISIAIIYHINSLGNFYSIKNRVNDERCKFFFVTEMPKNIVEINEIFMFTKGGKQNYDNIFIPFNTEVTIADYISKL